ncbi:hypothetical protein [Halorussus amylolyticus]|uniref:hypothetical protein n=1 Tax=Halorussus amylolyticus TaxID=1126242 RepID=UPI001046781B|nr:hypothetical protein [Halorussus amylolyticus]
MLATFGSVVRVTIEPRENPYVDQTFQMDLMAETPDLKLDLALLHPKCTDKSQMTSISGDPDDHENQIGRAREIAQEIATDYVLENKPRDDLRNPTVLNGKMFGLPIHYERAFETSFRVETPPRERTLGEKTVSPYFFSDRTHDWWQATKGYRHHWPKEHLAKNALPAVYVQHLVRSWLETTTDHDGETIPDNNGPPPRKVSGEQATLTDDGPLGTKSDGDRGESA